VEAGNGGKGLQFSRIRDQLVPKLTVFVPVLVLTAVFAVLATLILSDLGPDLRPSREVLVGGGLLYAVTAALLVAYGLQNFGRLERIALTDSLSGIANRRALHHDFLRLAQEGEERALALIDLDGFKAVNDHYGHFIGDRVIKQCAGILEDLCGEDALSYRLGGDEFAILVLGPIAGNILEGICRNLLARLARPIQVDDRAITLGASIGLSRSTGSDGLSSSELLRRSDVSMYASKQGGKMRCTWFKEEFDQRREQVQQIEQELRDALTRDEFRLLYQPLVDAKSCEVVAVEALLRWERGERERIGPDVFVPIAEETGLINPIGLWVLRKACREALAWDPIKLSVNVSAAQLRNPEFPVQLGHVLEETGFPPSRLELEVTETYLVGDITTAGRSLEMIRGFGVGVVLDDFGTGYASIGFLRNFRFEKLKLDRTLIVDAARDDSSRAMMISSIAVARAMAMDVTAEGVETEAQAALVRTAGCDQIQGWLYFKAITAAEVSEHLANRSLVDAALKAVPLTEMK